jgi:leucyl-tRNA synthetase
MKRKNKIDERKWIEIWKKINLYKTDLKKVKSSFYNLWMFPYPSGEGLHMGTAFASTGSDVFGRYIRMNGREVFQPIGYDSFGIHSENFAIKIKEQPRDMLERITKNYESQLKRLGHGYDWSRTVTTSNVDYYHWTQWLFVELFKAGLAYKARSGVNWCQSCKTVIADEQVINKECERCGSKIEIRELEQWFFRITKYAERLLKNLSKIEWPERVKIAQRNWIGRKEGIKISYPIKGSKKYIDCWTSRPDTNFGATFIVLAPEHPFVKEIVTKKSESSISKYVITAISKSKEERIEEGREKTGVFTGRYAENRLNGKKMPVWVSDFVLMDYGTGAVVGVPGHDKRDFEFAKKYRLPILRVVVGTDKDKKEIKEIDQVQEDEGVMVNSGFLNGMDIHKATVKIMDYLEDKKWGKREVEYHLRDWLISRQRYWGPPIPMIFCEYCKKRGKSYFNVTYGNLLHQDQSDWEHYGWYPEEKLPVKLPYLKDYKPKGKGYGPLADHPEFFTTKCPNCNKQARRETDVSDTFLDSSWYFLRYPSVGLKSSSKLPFDVQVTKDWLPVDLYFGGAEHSVLHLMYSRFVWMVLYDLRYLSSGKKKWKSERREPFPKFYAHGLMIKDGAKMSKSRGNIVNPDEYLEKFGADTLRLYLMFMGPMDGYPDFRDTGIEGMKKFVDRVWNIYKNYKDIVINDVDDKEKIRIKMHKTIKKVTEDIEKFHYNTAISAIMEYVNLLRENAVKYKTKNVSKVKSNDVWKEALENLALLLAPFAPFMTEEVWEKYINAKMKRKQSSFKSIHKSSWPKYDSNVVKDREVNVVIQVNGKLRSVIKVDRRYIKDKEKIIKFAKEDKKISDWIANRKINDTIYVTGRLVNFVVSKNSDQTKK